MPGPAQVRAGGGMPSADKSPPQAAEAQGSLGPARTNAEAAPATHRR